MALESGSRLGPYEVVGLLGSGGMGEVYRARDPRLGREVAIKVLPEEVSDRKRLGRFEQEARAAGALNHPNVLAVYDIGTHDSAPYVVSELLKGQTLRVRLEGGALPVRRALDHALQIAHGLAAAHDKGIVHRDLKPDNIFVTEDGRVKILDFGLAKLTRSGPLGGGDDERSTMNATESGAVMGTVGYMSPEQVRGEAADPRSDIFSFGAVLYEMLSGLRAFRRPSAAETMNAILKEDPPALSGTGRATPPGLARIVERCLEKRAGERFRSAHDLALALEAVSSGVSEPVRPPTDDAPAPARRPLSYVWMALTAALAVALAAALLRDAGEEPPAPQVTRTLLPLPPGPRGLRGLAISPDGTLVAYSTNELYLRRLDRLEPTVVEGAAGAYNPFFSADSRWLGFVWDGIRTVPITGGAPTTITADGFSEAGASWSTEDMIVGASGVTKGGLLRVRADGGTPEALCEPDLDEGHYSYLWPQVLPGGGAVLLTVAHAEMDTWDEALIGVFRRDTGELRIVLEGGSRARYTATGHLVYMQGSSLLAIPFDLAGLRVTGTPVPVLEGVSDAGAFELSDDGTLLYAPGEVSRGGGRMLLVDRRGNTLQVLSEGRGDHQPRFSPDGERLAYATGDVTSDIRVLDLARGAETVVTTRWLNGSARWTPDGRYVVFGSNRSGEWNSHRRLADGSGEIEHLLATDHINHYMGAVDDLVLWHEESPKGTGWDLLLRSERDGSLVRPFAATPADEAFAELSPDQAWVAYVSTESGREEVYLRRFPEGAGKWSVSVGGGRQPRWNRNGREIFYLDLDLETVMAVDVRTDGDSPRLGTPRPLFKRPILFSWPYDEYDVAPDGQTFVIVERSEPTPPPDHLVLVQNFGEELKRLVLAGS
jgi:hypothetical protein